MKVGLYDPESLKMDGDRMTISFLNAADASDVTTIRIETAEQARSIREALEAQKSEISCPFHPIEGELSVMSGVFHFSEGRTDEGLIGRFEGAGKKRRMVTIPFQMGFAVGKGELPEAGRCIAKGYHNEGALTVLHMAMMPAGAVAEKAFPMTPPSEAH